MPHFKATMHQSRFRLRSAPDPAGGAYNVPPDFLLSLRGPTPKGEQKREGKERRRREGGKAEWKGREVPYFRLTLLTTVYTSAFAD